jgi:hypothetical protein
MINCLMHFHVYTCLNLCHFLQTCVCGHVCVWCRGSGVRAVSLEDTLEEERSAFKDEKNRCFMLIHSSPDTHTHTLTCIMESVPEGYSCCFTLLVEILLSTLPFCFPHYFIFLLFPLLNSSNLPSHSGIAFRGTWTCRFDT